MRNHVKALLVIPVLLIAISGCSTTGHFKIPAGSKLQVTDRVLEPDSSGTVTTSPFFWSSTAGANYRLVDANGNLIREGKLKTHFRVVSIFWPPVAIAYWPMGFMEGEYDLTAPADGVMVKDEGSASPRAMRKKNKK